MNLSIPTLPRLPMLVHPLVGENVVESRLMTNFSYQSGEHAIAEYRNNHPAESLEYARVYFVQPVRHRPGYVSVSYVLIRQPRRTKNIGVTVDDLAAIKILIGNHSAGMFLPDMRFEIYEDIDCNDLMDVGRLDQWDLLRGLSSEMLLQLRDEKGIEPRGNWDFHQWLHATTCSVCGDKVSINVLAYSIDSVVCASCGNRPYLAPSLHEMLDSLKRVDQKQSLQMKLRALDWMSHVHANFGEVRQDARDQDGGRVRSACWDDSPMAKALDPQRAVQMKESIDAITSLGFDVYQRLADKVRKALSGEEEFGHDHKIAMDFILGVTRMLEVQHLTNNSST